MNFNLNDIRISLFCPGISTPQAQKPISHISLHQLIVRMSQPDIQRKIQHLRTLPDHKQQSEFKRSQLPFVTFGGTFSHRRHDALIQPSSLLCLDFDGLSAQQLASVRQQLPLDPFFSTILLFSSPSGYGLKWVTFIDLQRDSSYAHWYSAILHYISHTYHLQADPAPSNIASACFLSHDPNIIIHPQLSTSNNMTHE